MRGHRLNSTGLVLLAGALVLVGCSDDPTSPHEHSEPEGVELVLGGQVVASYDHDSQAWTGELEVDVGEETDHIEVVFVDHDGDPVDLDEGEFYLEVVVDNESIAEFEQHEPGEFEVHLVGLAVGETMATFKLMHGAVGSGHADFTTTKVHVHVNP